MDKYLQTKALMPIARRVHPCRPNIQRKSDSSVVLHPLNWAFHWWAISIASLLLQIWKGTVPGHTGHGKNPSGWCWSSGPLCSSAGGPGWHHYCPGQGEGEEWFQFISPLDTLYFQHANLLTGCLKLREFCLSLSWSFDFAWFLSSVPLWACENSRSYWCTTLSSRADFSEAIWPMLGCWQAWPSLLGIPTCPHHGH
jgi:hypothetical protein